MELTKTNFSRENDVKITRCGSSDNEWYYCMLCTNDSRFKSIMEFMVHRYSVHANELYPCPNCTLRFSKSEELMKHGQIYHPT